MGLLQQRPLVNRRERLLVVQRTGWDKSFVYFISTRILRDRGRGPTLIVSPLLALMRNQIEAAERLEVRARTVNSTNQDDWPGIERAVRRNEVDALLVSPERLANEEFVEEVLLPIAERIGLLVVDEAHCISDLDHDFCPDYRSLVNILQRMPANVPILGTTATANNRVIEDVHNQLGDIGMQRGSLMRFRCRCPPWLDQRQPPLLQLGDDLAGDVVVKIAAGGMLFATRQRASTEPFRICSGTTPPFARRF